MVGLKTVNILPPCAEGVHKEIITNAISQELGVRTMDILSPSCSLYFGWFYIGSLFYSLEK